MPQQYIEAGAETSYSNYSYGLAGLALEKATEQNFAVSIHQQITAPLKMTRTFLRLSGR